MRPSGRFGFRAQLIADQAVDGTVAEVDVVFLGQIALNLPVAGKALRLCQPLLETRQGRRGESAPFPWRFLEGQQRGEPTRFILGQPRPDGMAMDGQQGRQRDTGGGLPTGQQI